MAARIRSTSQPAAGTLGLETNRAPLPQAAVARIAHTRALYQRPQTSLQVRAADPPRQAFPCSSHLPPEPTALPRCFTLLSLALCHTAPFVSAIPAAAVHPRRCCFASGTRISSHACMRAAGLRSPTPPRNSNTTVQAQMPVWILLCSTSNTDACSHPRTDTLLEVVGQSPT